MTVVCYVASAVAIIAAVLVITGQRAMHALLHLVLMLLALALVFFTLGAPFVAALQVVIYAGAIMVLFVFVVMMLNLGPPGERQERRWLGAEVWAIPVLLTAVLLALCGYAIADLGTGGAPAGVVGPKEVGIALYRDYLLAVEIASLLLVAGLVGAFHLAPPTRGGEEAQTASANSRQPEGTPDG
jgi:NADH-quinone oxidoreductase subunit J